MVPSNGWTFILFLLLVCPGLRYELLAQRRFARPDESVFFQISRVLLASVCFAAVASAVVAVLNIFIVEATLADLVNRTEYLQDEPSSAITLVGAQFIISMLLVQTQAWWVQDGEHRIRSLKRKEADPPSSRRSILPVHAWTDTFDTRVPPSPKKGMRVHAYVRVRMTDGRNYFGIVESFTAGPDAPRREIVLTQPLHAGPRGTEPKSVSNEYERLILADEHIDSIAVGYYEHDLLFPPDSTEA